ncbi:oxaloacetate decarboxylase beta subunit [Caldanaerobacter subterraneus subsp. tengcongensis MB4]|uniref:Na+-transporting methylmalonyl-CoA/oxaloacetate decarboxylase, beta subunit n=1 Tax=Caldanaerobacter subterraneus subsp. tengcongensis (strain DSM 15242 / JCM 11007 / NBRC 100824 / MB4) TaxID=273068 RepID=Q8RAJ8_CALS4|nr:sodium ion-translocating decarboxylase subunit beta [Caldanaerobacter subterraneus]AAM24445.1 Na+-transporting methylmalonyl-CoA/oxaloacetate decarboxylase, beta subunit [Caldanaerobacter subterraneus subsp. tengcongensis MB4]MCS3915997.1 oxaloacetate decarboxylase beta subunit [Caldanaerobacter subterraneus subsp. tengcongensis MB4]
MEAFRIFIEGISNFTLGHLIMLAIGGILIYLAIKKEYEPMLLLPIGFGIILTNIPLSAAIGKNGFLTLLYNAGINTELFPILIFIAVGAMVDFTPLFQQPFMIFFGAAAQVGIFLTMIVAYLMGFDIGEAASIGIIGAADGPTSIYVSTLFAPHLLGPISVAAYSYMALVPIIQPPIIRMLTTKEERRIRMELELKEVPKVVRIIFPIAVTLITGILIPQSVPLIGSLMFGNLIKESGVVERLSKAAQNELANITTILLGITIGATMTPDRFLNPATLLIFGMGLLAFIFDTAGGVLFAKFLNLFLKRKVNPMIGAAGISAFPMSARVIQKMAQQEDFTNFVLMQSVAANVSGQIGSVVAGGILIGLVSSLFM